MPWQKYALVHGLETLPDGSYRFRKVIVLVARQNGKTTNAQVLAPWRMEQDDAELVVGTSTTGDMAKEAWLKTIELLEDNSPELIEKILLQRGAEQLTLTNRARYRPLAANRRGGRSLAVDLGLADELREHRDWEAVSALDGALTARHNAQLWCLSNAGDDGSVVLNSFRDQAAAAIQTGDTDSSTICLLEWSAEDDCELDDRRGWAQANPALGITITEATLASKLATLPPNVFRTEHLCQRVQTMDAAIDEAAWRANEDRVMTLDGLRDKVCLCLDVSPDLGHVTLAAAALDRNGIGRLEVVRTWPSTMRARHELPEIIAQVRPRAIGWFPGGPAAALGADLRDIRHAQEIKSGEVSAACMALAEQVQARRILHNGEGILSSHIIGAAKMPVGDGWRFVRNGVGHVDAAYAAAGALHLARTLPARPRMTILVGRASSS